MESAATAGATSRRSANSSSASSRTNTRKRTHDTMSQPLHPPQIPRRLIYRPTNAPGLHGFFSNIWNSVKDTIEKIVHAVWEQPEEAGLDSGVESPPKRSRSEERLEETGKPALTASLAPDTANFEGSSSNEQNIRPSSVRTEPLQTASHPPTAPRPPTPPRSQSAASNSTTSTNSNYPQSVQIFKNSPLLNLEKEEEPFYPLIPRKTKNVKGQELLRRALSRRDNTPKRAAPIRFGAMFPNHLNRSPMRRPQQSGSKSSIRSGDLVGSKIAFTPQRTRKRTLGTPGTKGQTNARVTKRVQKPTKVQEAYRKSQSLSSTESETLDVLINQLVQNKVAGFQSFEQVMKQREERQREIKKLKELAVKRKIKREQIPPLSTQLQEKVIRVTQEVAADFRRKTSKTYINKFNIPITTSDLQRLFPGIWLNDEIINFYLNLICERNNKNCIDGTKRVAAHNSYFWGKLKKEGYKGVSRWARRQGVAGDAMLKLDYLFMPVHVGGNHWCMAVVNFKHKRFEYYDSLGGSITARERPLPYQMMREYIKQETGGKCDFSGWANYAMKGAPQQNNTSDCGVFALKTAEVIARGGHLDFTAKDMPLIRHRMIAEIIRGELLPVEETDNDDD